MAAHQSNNSGDTSTALVTPSHALQSNADPLDPVFRANPEIRRLILGCGTPTDKQLQALCWYSWDRVKRGAGLATSRLLRYPRLFPEAPPLRIVWAEEQRDVVEAAWREEHWFNLPPQGTKFGKVERVALLRAAAIPWLARRRGSYVPRERGSGSSGVYGVFERASGRWRVRLKIAGEQVYVGTCDEKEDAARFVDLISVVVNREAPENFPGPFQKWLEAGGHGDVPADLVEAALRRDGDVDVAGAVSDGAAEALDALASAEKEIEEARGHPLAFKKLGDVSSLPASIYPDKVLATWTANQVEVMEEAKDGPDDLYDLALIDVENKQLALAMTKGTCSSYTTARRTLWRWKHAAAALLDVKLAWDPPPKNGIGKNVSKEERSPAHQRALDVASRWVAHAGTPDPAFVKDYAEALADIARDGVAEPPQKKRRR